MNKRPIDQRREAAASMKVGLEEEGKITGFYKLGEERLLLLKERAVYEMRFADSIDPERTNEEIPNIQQRVLSVGSEHELIQMILLTSDRLFDPTYLRELDCGLLRERALDATREILGMDRTFQRMRVDEESLIARLEGQTLKDGFILPHLDDAVQDVKNLFQRADHFTREMFLITRIFEKGFGDLDNLERRARNEKPRNDQFINFLERACRYLKFIRNARNAVEHPIREKRVDVFNFELNAKGNIVLPSIEVVHPKTREPRTALVKFMHDTIESLANLYGEWISHLCARRAFFPGFAVSVARLPEDMRPDKRVSYSYMINVGGEWQPIG